MIRSNFDVELSRIHQKSSCILGACQQADHGAWIICCNQAQQTKAVPCWGSCADFIALVPIFRPRAGVTYELVQGYFYPQSGSVSTWRHFYLHPDPSEGYLKGLQDMQEVLDRFFIRLKNGHYSEDITKPVSPFYTKQGTFLEIC